MKVRRYFPVRPYLRDGRQLQWGRTDEGAEMQLRRGALTGTLLLQWGRTDEGAEITTPAEWRAAGWCFNGAAPMKVRRLLYTPQHDYVVCTLQWGRTDEGAEICQVVAIAVVRTSRLQWGRTDEGAEIPFSDFVRPDWKVASMGPHR